MANNTLTEVQRQTVDALGKEFTNKVLSSYVEALLAEIQYPTSGSARARSITKLKDVFASVGIDCPDDLLSCETEEIEEIVNHHWDKFIKNAEDMEFSMLQVLLDKYQEFAAPEAYMLRIVNALENPEDGWSRDPLRLRILKQFIKYGNYLKCFDCQGEDIIKEYVAEKSGKAHDKLSMDDVLSGLDDGIFFEYEKRLPDAKKSTEERFYKSNEKKIEKITESQEQLIVQENDLRSHFDQYKLPDTPDLRTIETEEKKGHAACLDYARKTQFSPMKTEGVPETLVSQNGVDAFRKKVNTAIRVKYAEEIQGVMDARAAYLEIQSNAAAYIKAKIKEDLDINVHNINGVYAMMEGEDIVAILQDKAYVRVPKPFDEDQITLIYTYVREQCEAAKESFAAFLTLKTRLHQNLKENFGCEISPETMDLLIDPKSPAKPIKAFYAELEAIVCDQEMIQSYVEAVTEVTKWNSKKSEFVKDALKSFRKKFALIRQANELASGLFKTSGSTKEALYQFAIVYGMTFGIADEDHLDPRREVEKNLFVDYYNNNMMRFLGSEYEGHMADYDVDPVGTGINYKNFVEMIYLYYLRRDVALDHESLKDADDAHMARYKLESVKQMIDDIKRAPNRRIYNEETDDIRTKQYRGYYREKNKPTYEKFDVSPSDFKEFLLQEYYIGSTRNYMGDMMFGVQQQTAFGYYQQFISFLMKWEEEDKVNLMNRTEHEPLASYSYGLSFTDIAAIEKMPELREKLGDKGDENIDKFLALLKRVNNILGHTANEHKEEKKDKDKKNHNDEEMDNGGSSLNIKKAIKALTVKDSKSLTRTSFLVAFYYYFTHREERKGKLRSGSAMTMTFSDFFDKFCGEADECLRRSYYQPINTKSIFDMLLIFSSYMHLYAL